MTSEGPKEKVPPQQDVENGAPADGPTDGAQPPQGLSKSAQKKLEKNKDKKPKMSKEEKEALWGKKKEGGNEGAGAGDAKEKKKKGKPEGEGAAATSASKTAFHKNAWTNPTPPGEKKSLTHPMESSYEPVIVEAAWDSWWEKEGFFSPTAEQGKNTLPQKKFVMVIPPPNVTGNLHIGHTLTTAIEDTLTRWHRMKGDVSLWVPGQDHAGIATQTVVERQIQKLEGKTRHDYGREAFVNKVWEWKKQKGGNICMQTRRLAASVDWSREAFTLDDKLSKAVKEAFVRMFDAGLIYRGTRLVSWCPHLRTALSDIEVDTDDVEPFSKVSIPGFDKQVEVGVLVHFLYKIKGSDETVEVATTRIETMLGDTAVAVHPEDPRYKHLHGKELEHPFIPGRKMVIVTDPELVDMNFGTGAVKITPAHDPNDYECGKKHNLEFINILTEDGKINENGGEMFKGMHRFECRLQIIEALTNKGLFVKKSANPMRLGKCSRTGDIIEPMLIPQWWVDCKDMARRSVEAVRKGDLKIVPSHHEQTWYNWLENIKDWCVSRQLWWGHRIPAYKVVEPAPSSVEETVWVVGRSKEEAEERAKQKTGAASVKIEQDEDVLDTWFSSGLFPFSVFGWPDQTEELDAFFPTSLLETGHDILFFWVARMVMMSLQLTDRLPFHTVYLHAMVRDRHGRKMSKSLGNVIDPLEVINGIVLDGLLQKVKEGNLPQKEIKAAELLMKDDFPNGIPECGADALRYGLLAYTKQGRSINLDVNRVVAYRFFCNKLWNATRFALMKFPEGFRARGVETAAVCGSSKSEKGVLDWADRWILHRLSACCGATNKAIEEFQFADAVQATYNFWLYEFCDFYLEIIKPVFQTTDTSEAAESRKRGTLEVLYCCLDRGLRLLCPMMPFVTEELYQRLPPSAWKRDSICTADFPLEVVAWTNTRADDEFRLFSAVVKHFRALQVSLDLPPKERPDGIAGHRDPAFRAFLSQRAADISTVSRMGIVRVLWEGGEGEGSMPSEGPGAAADSGELGKCVKDVVSDQCDVFLDCSGMTNLGQTVSRIAKKIETAEKSLASYQKKASIPDYETKVPEDVRQMNAEKMATLTEELAGLRGAKENLDRIIAAAGAGAGTPNGSPA